MPLLLDGGRLSVALSDYDTAKVAAIFTGHLLPDGLTQVRTEANLTIQLGRVEENSPAIVGHLHIPELRPPPRITTRALSQVHVVLPRAFRPHFGPPLQELRLPVLERPLQSFVARQVYVVGNLLIVVDIHHESPYASRRAPS